MPLKRFVFYKVPPSDKRSLLWLANWPRALWLAEHHKPRWKCNAPFHNRKLRLSKLNTVNNVLSFTISSSPKEEQSRVTDSDDARMCLQTSHGCVTMSPSLTHTSTHTSTHTHTHTHDSALWPPLSLSLSLSLSLTHSLTHDMENSAFEQSIANTYTTNKTYSSWFRSARLSLQSQNYLLS